MSIGGYNWGRWLNGPLPFYDDPATQQATQQPVGGYQTAQDTGWSHTATPLPTYTAPSTIGGFTMPPLAPGTGAPGGDTYDGFPRPPFPGGGGTLAGTSPWAGLPAGFGGGDGWTRGGFTPPMEDGTPAVFGGVDWSGPPADVTPAAPSQSRSGWDANPFGYDYSAVAPGYNAWSLYDNGTDGGWYDPAADRLRHDSGRGNGSTYNTRETIWRWTLDDLRSGNNVTGEQYDPGKAPIEVVNQTMLRNVARMHRDFDANKWDWQKSGFANMDRALPGRGTVPQAPGDATKGAGGNTMGSPLPPMGSGLVAGAEAAGDTLGRTPGAAGPLNSIGGQKLANSPELAWRYLVQQMGGDADYEGPFSNYMQSNYAPALAAMINARLTGAGRVPGGDPNNALSGMDQIGKYIGEFGGMLGGNDLFTKLGGIGQQGLAAGGGLLNQASSQDAGNFVRQMLALTGMGNSPLGQSAQQYLTNKMINDYTMSSINNEVGQSPLGKFGTYFQSSKFQDKLRSLGLLR